MFEFISACLSLQKKQFWYIIFDTHVQVISAELDQREVVPLYKEAVVGVGEGWKERRRDTFLNWGKTAIDGLILNFAIEYVSVIGN